MKINILKQVKLLLLTSMHALLLGMEQPQVISLPIQNNIVSALELGVKAAMKENQKKFLIPILEGGFVEVGILHYEYGNIWNSSRDKNRDAEISDPEFATSNPRFKINITINGVHLDSLEWLSHVFEVTDEQSRLFFQKWLYNLSIHNSGLTLVCGSWFSLFKNLETLDLAQNNIIGFDENDLKLPKTLRTINFSENNIASIPTTLFQQRLPWVESINLSKNHINLLKAEMFSGLVFLNLLNLSGNAIISLPDNVFYKVGELFNFFRLNINLCNNPIFNEYRRVDMNKLGFSKCSGNKIIFDRVDDGQSTPRIISLSL